MSITLQIDDVLAEGLRREASVERISPEDLARRLMHDGLEERSAQRRWVEHNRRRLQLIAKKRHSSLTTEESAEVAALQELAAERAAPFDRELRRAVEELQREAGTMP